MKKFIVERNLPGAANLSSEELRAISKMFLQLASQMARPYTWVQSFITDDKIYCIHIAESEEKIREHSKLAKSFIPLAK